MHLQQAYDSYRYIRRDKQQRWVLFRVGIGSPEARASGCGSIAFILARRVVASMGVGVPLAVLLQAVDVRRLQAGDEAEDTDCAGVFVAHTHIGMVFHVGLMPHGMSG